MSQKNRSDLYEEFQNGDIPNENDFADTIDSALNLVDDGLTSYKVSTPAGMLKRFGIGDTAPTAPLGLKGEPGQDDQMVTFTSHDASQKWNINLNPTSGNVSGFSIDDETSGTGTSRLFIDQVSQGNVGIGTVEPLQKLHVSGANDGANVSIMVENLESGDEQGWLMSAIDDNTVNERIKTFAIQEKTGSELDERITILAAQGPAPNPIKNVGINEILPYATLHVTKPASDPTEPVNMAENTGILCLGQIDDNNLVMDSSEIQARLGGYVAGGPTLAFTPSELALQPFGGTITVNKASAVLADKVTIGSDGKIGVGKTAVEKVEINGAVVVGDTNTASPSDGTIRWNQTAQDLQVWQNAQWNSLTTHTNTDGLWVAGGPALIYYNPTGQHPKVGIGVSQANATLHVKETNTENITSSGAALIHNQASTLLSDPALGRVALALKCSGVWSSNAACLNVGLYISDVSGQTAHESNIAALMNGNVVIGNITGNSLIGSNGANVFAIQNGQAPTSIPGLTATTGIQLYSDTVTSTLGTPMSALHLMNGDGLVIKLYRQADMTPADINVPNTGNAVTDALIENMRTRINELEAILKALGLLNP